jgi:methyl-accepting chemotaxis protein
MARAPLPDQPAGTVSDSFLPLAEAARRLGLSRLKLREAIAKGVIHARRDNEGRWRVDMDAVPDDLAAAIAARPAAPEALMGALFDEIEELSADLETTQDMNERLARLAGAQSDALERLADTLDARTAERDRLSSIAGRAIDAATEAEARAAALQTTTDRALGLLDRAAAAIETVKAEVTALRADAAAKDDTIAGHGAQLDRLFTLSEQALEKAAEVRRGPGLVARMFGTGRRN